MSRKYFISYWALLAGVVISFPQDSDAVIRAGNKGHALSNAYSQLNLNANPRENTQNNNIIYDTPQTQDYNNDVNLPIRVANNQLAHQIRTGATNINVTMDDLDRCSMIYPGGQFEWATPNLGTTPGTGDTCVAVVEMRAMSAGANGEDLVLAVGNVAAGAAFKCNISSFPQSGYTNAAGKFEFPADNQPTIEDVVQVMNQEQKQHAGLKIAASVLVGGLVGNATGQNDVGKEGLLGTSKSKIKNTAIGGLGAAALTAASSFSGKVAGDTIMAAGVNAVAGGIYGNATAESSDEVVRISICKDKNEVEHKCIFGYVMNAGNLEKTDTGNNNYEYFYDITKGSAQQAERCKKINDTTYTDCKTVSLIDIELAGNMYEAKTSDNKTAFDVAKEDGFRNFDKNRCARDSNNKDNIICDNTSDTSGAYVIISTARTVTRKTPAAIIITENKPFGLKKNNWKNAVGQNPKIYSRSGNGQISEYTKTTTEKEGPTINEFYPVYADADSGDVIDLSNQARMKSTLTGAGVGGALGGFAGYQGAQDEIQERYVAAINEYKDSLQKVYCATGTRFLSMYNDTTDIPNMQTPNE